MATRTAAVCQLLDQAAAQIGGTGWSVVGGNRLRSKLNDEAEALILPLAAGYVNYTVSFEVGPRFPAIERLVSKASRTAGVPEASLRTSSIFPTVFDRLGRISPIRDYAPLADLEQIVEAIRVYAVPFIQSISTVQAAAEYALANPLAYGAHAMRIPILLAKAGRLTDAHEYLDGQISAKTPYTEFLMRYRDALVPLL